MGRRDSSAPGGDPDDTNPSTSNTVKLRRSKRNLRTNDHDESSCVATSAPEGSVDYSEALGNTHRTSLESIPVAGPSTASSNRPHSTSNDPKTPNTTTQPEPGAPKFTPGTGVEMLWAYMLEDCRNRTRHDVYQGNRQRAEGQIVVGVRIADWLAQCAPLTHNSDSNMPEYWEAKSLELFTEKKVPSVHGEAKLYNAIKVSGVFPPGGMIPKDTHYLRGEDVNDPVQKYSPDMVVVDPDVDITVPGVARARLLLPRTQLVADQKSNAEDPVGDSDKGREALGQLITYSEVVSSNSHRTSVPAFVVLPEKAYLIRLDHSGLIISEPFAWRKTGHLLCFLSRLSNMLPVERGVDTTVEMVSPQDEMARKMKRLLETDLRDALPTGIAPKTIFPTGKFGDRALFHVFDSENRRIHRVLSHRPLHYDASGYVGSGVRWWVGVDVDDESVVFFKTYWRIERPGILSESDVHRIFREAQSPVEHTLGFLYGGDVLVNAWELRKQYGAEPIPMHEPLVTQRTFTHEFVKRNSTEYSRLWSERGHKDDQDVEILPRVHHISVFRTVARRLRTFESTRELVRVLHHATLALEQAYKANILHRNITSISVAIDCQGNGVVMNWDWASLAVRGDDSPRTKSREISLLFASASMLQFPDERAHLLRDDLESILHLLYYHVLRFRPTLKTRQIRGSQVLQALKSIYESSTSTETRRIDAGSEKATFMSGESTFSDRRLNGAIRPLPLWTLMRSLRAVFEPLYIPEPSLYGDETAESLVKVNDDKRYWREQFECAGTRLQSAQPLLACFEDALQKSDWPPSDGAVDQYPKDTRPSTGSRAFTSSLTSSLASASTKSGTKRYSDGPGNLPVAKRQKMSPVVVDDIFGPSTSTRSPNVESTRADEDEDEDEEKEKDDGTTEEDLFLGNRR
ncbi:unnamed protein product [Peniophora sp. CBMAI 1063]|nr:unnamed protein product [Peniophora sp. CBMAI 1063]